LSTHLRFKALVVQRRLTDYRVPFFEALRLALADRDCALRLAFGDPTEEEAVKQDSGNISWGERLETRYLFDGRLCWQPFYQQGKDADVTIITSENKLIYNLVVQYSSKPNRVVLWGHGANLQGDENSLRERFKRVVARRADWWLAYTQLSVPLIERSGFPGERITVLHNAVDTTELAALRAKISDEELLKVRKRVGVEGGHVGIFIGSLYAEKRIEFMLEAAEKIRILVPDFELLVVGAGVQKSIVNSFCSTRPWVKYLGALKGQAKVDALAISNVMVNPGLVGLGILDSFVCEVPMVTTDCGLHSPEIAYLTSGENGLMTENSLIAFSTSVADVLLGDRFRRQLMSGCEASAKEYTTQNMARRFAEGVLKCLVQPRYRP